ncbi:MAG: GTPase, partial [Pseudomonadota bacterium]
MNLPTVFALSTAPGKAGIAIFRVTGSKATTVVEELTRRDCPAVRQSVLRRLFDETGELLDEALVLFFAAPSSFTGEDVVELHCHGGRALTEAVLRRLAGFDGVEPAEPGEFTRRAFVNGKLDLTEIESLSDLLSAETEAQRRQSVAAVGGGVRRRAEAIRGHLLHALALIEATIDWADEDVPEDVVPEVREKLHEAAGEMRVLLSGVEQRERLRTGFEVALVGAPNAGKSSIMNRLADREVALTTPIAGTTRDIIEVQLDLRGLPVTV